MKKIGLLSDTHAYLNPKIFKHFKDCDEIWHAGDWGSIEVAEELLAFKPVRAVHGNIDSYEIRKIFPASCRFLCEEVDVFITHIGGYPGKYAKSILEILQKNPPQLFISGHSHILRVAYDKNLDLLHINPGAAGKYGFHTKETLIRFEIDKKKIQNLEVIELNPF